MLQVASVDLDQGIDCLQYTQDLGVFAYEFNILPKVQSTTINTIDSRTVQQLGQ